jgi:hypothetical protein
MQATASAVSKPPTSIEMHHERLVGQDRHCPCSIDHLSLKGHLYLTGRDVSDRERGGTDHPKGEAPTVRRRSPRDIGKTGTYTSWLAHAHCMASRWRPPTRNATSPGDACRTPHPATPGEFAPDARDTPGEERVWVRGGRSRTCCLSVSFSEAHHGGVRAWEGSRQTPRHHTHTVHTSMLSTHRHSIEGTRTIALKVEAQHARRCTLPTTTTPCRGCHR